MSILLRSLRLLELVDQPDGSTVSALALALGVDKATTSRMTSLAVAEGWLTRTGRRITPGPRAALVARTSPYTALLDQAEQIAQAVAGSTGFITQAVGLVGTGVVALASAQGQRTPIADIPTGLRTALPLWAGAGPKVVAAQLSDSEIQRRVPARIPDPRQAMTGYGDDPDHTYHPRVLTRPPPTDHPAAGPPTRAHTRTELMVQIGEIRRSGVFIEREELLPHTGCIAVPWPHQPLPSAIACIGLVTEIDNLRPQVLTALLTAVQGGTVAGTA